MKTNRRTWSAEEHRRYLETWLTGLSGIVCACGKPLAAIALIAAFLTGQADKFIHWILRFF
jgi:hypothetical protein